MKHSFYHLFRKKFKYNWPCEFNPTIYTMEKEQNKQLSLLDRLVTLTEWEFWSSVYRKSTLTVQSQNYNSHHPWNVQKEIIRCLRYQTEVVCSDNDAYKKNWIITVNLHRNNYTKNITSALKNLDWATEINIWKLTIVSLPLVKVWAERIKKLSSPYDIRTIFRSELTPQKYIFQVKHPTKCNMTKNCV